MANPDNGSDIEWPPPPYKEPTWPIEGWLRLQSFPLDRGRPARIAAHPWVPYAEEVNGMGTPDGTVLGRIAHNYLTKLNDFLEGRDLEDRDKDRLALPPGWLVALSPDAAPRLGVLRWLPVWPPVDVEDPGTKPRLASWNLSREDNYALPTSITMVAAEVYSGDESVVSHSIGLQVPMAVTKTDTGALRVEIRSVSIELPRTDEQSLTEIVAGLPKEERMDFLDVIGSILDYPINSEKFAAESSASALVDQNTRLVEELRFSFPEPKKLRSAAWTIKSVGKAQDPTRQGPRRRSVQLVSSLKVELDDSLTPDYTFIRTETCPFDTHAVPGNAKVFPRTPPEWFDAAEPAASYDWRSRRPHREDDILDGYRVLESLRNNADVPLEDTGFRIRLCPEIVKADRGVAGQVKHVQLPEDSWPPPRRDNFSAISAFFNCRRFFALLTDFGIDPTTFVVRAQDTAQVFYRSGIFPGPGGDGKTINAQVAFDCRSQGELPFINIRLALAQRNRWARPVKPGFEPSWAQPLGIATSGRWMMHEFGHYLLAARLGKLEFDFAHSAGDAMAAIYYDPMSRLADTRGGVADSFRGFTYPFVFATRRHDREVLLGWAWYGTLNRSALAAPPGDCDDTKGYLTEQILSTTLFRLYRVLGGDTMAGDAPDRYVRRRASHMALFLLVKAIQSFGPNPSAAEMLELGIENAGLNMMTALPVPTGPIAPPPLADEWQPGLTHKVVRWAFEAQGMFPADPNEIVNAPGKPPPVDVYVRNQRPEGEAGPAGPVSYGHGAYTPVSLDWTGPRAWTLDPNSNVIHVGNRGSHSANQVTLRYWIGQASSPATVNEWELKKSIRWIKAYGPVPIGSLSGELMSEAEYLENPLTDLDALTGNLRLLLVEVSSPDDRANTDPAAQLDAAVPDGAAGLSSLPKIPRQLTDLVANDNNLGLQVRISS